MTVGERIKQLRLQNELSLTEVALKINTPKQNLYKYENNIITNIPSNKIELLAEVLNTTPAYLMGWDNEPQRVSNTGFAERLKKIRKENQITMSELAEILGLSTSAIVNFENGRSEPRCNILLRMSDIFDVDLDFLLGRSDIPNRALEQIDSPLSMQEKELLKKYNTLNETGKAKADEYVEDLADNPKYTQSAPETATTEADKHFYNSKIIDVGRAAAYGGERAKVEITEEMAKKVNILKDKLRDNEDI